ncbi:lysophospholipase L1-like esterase [Flavobacteriaceae bacterium MAR_2010_105]|nr:lysophospholipase L1-like esterase [Flavobacteriaceae bacterium MAR_2010_105]
MKNYVFFFFLMLFGIKMAFSQDWANLKRYQEANSKLSTQNISQRVVFMGNSITEGWSNISPEFFKNKPYINRGISGQTTPQMLLRFKQDVIELKPAVVVILAGINDIAGNTGPSTIDMIFDNIISMVELAKTNNIKVVICSVLPAKDFPWRPGLEPAEKVVKLNRLLQSYAGENNLVYVDYFSAMVDDENGLKAELGADGVHPNALGYSIMEPLVEAGIATAMK